MSDVYLMNFTLNQNISTYFLQVGYWKLEKLFRWGVIVCFIVLAAGILMSIYCDGHHYHHGSLLSASICRSLTSGQLIQSPQFPRNGRVYNGAVKSRPCSDPGHCHAHFASGDSHGSGPFYFLSERDYLYSGLTAVIVAGISIGLLFLIWRYGNGT